MAMQKAYRLLGVSVPINRSTDAIHSQKEREHMSAIKALPCINKKFFTGIAVGLTVFAGIGCSSSENNIEQEEAVVFSGCENFKQHSISSLSLRAMSILEPSDREFGHVYQILTNAHESTRDASFVYSRYYRISDQITSDELSEQILDMTYEAEGAINDAEKAVHEAESALASNESQLDLHKTEELIQETFQILNESKDATYNLRKTLNDVMKSKYSQDIDDRIIQLLVEKAYNLLSDADKNMGRAKDFAYSRYIIYETGLGWDFFDSEQTVTIYFNGRDLEGQIVPESPIGDVKPWRFSGLSAHEWGNDKIDIIGVGFFQCESRSDQID